MTESASKKLDLKVAIITVSDRSARGERDDLSGPAAKEALSEMLSKHDVNFDLRLVADDADDLKGTLKEFVKGGYDFIFTTGGTGIGPRDITPEVIREVSDKEIPGIGEAMRSFSMGITKNAMLSRGLAGMADGSLIIALPGSPKAVREILDFLGDTLEHACYMVQGLDIH
jgi:molybdenum cofactor synthesis domain-containing protein